VCFFDSGPLSPIYTHVWGCFLYYVVLHAATLCMVQHSDSLAFHVIWYLPFYDYSNLNGLQQFINLYLFKF